MVSYVVFCVVLQFNMQIFKELCVCHAGRVTFALPANPVRFKTIVPTYMELHHCAIGKTNVRP